MKSPLFKVILIFLLTLGCLYISLPSPLPIKFNLGKFKVEKEFKRGGIDISLGKFSFKRDLNLVLGLDLAGGSHLVFEADLSSIPAEEKNSALNGVKEVIAKRVNFFLVFLSQIFKLLFLKIKAEL